MTVGVATGRGPDRQRHVPDDLDAVIVAGAHECRLQVGVRVAGRVTTRQADDVGHDEQHVRLPRGHVDARDRQHQREHRGDERHPAEAEGAPHHVPRAPCGPAWVTSSAPGYRGRDVRRSGASRGRAGWGPRVRPLARTSAAQYPTGEMPPRRPLAPIAYTSRPCRHSSAVEQLFRKQQVLGSNPSVGSTPPRVSRVTVMPSSGVPMGCSRAHAGAGTLGASCSGAAGPPGFRGAFGVRIRFDSKHVSRRAMPKAMGSIRMPGPMTTAPRGPVAPNIAPPGPTAPPAPPPAASRQLPPPR